MTTIFENGWTTGEDLFLQSQNCYERFGFFEFQEKCEQLHHCKLYMAVPPRYPQTDPGTLDSYCFSNVRVCYWDQSHNTTMQDGLEFATDDTPGCVSAWPNLCIDRQAFNIGNSTRDDVTGESLSKLFDGTFESPTDTYAQNFESGAGIAYVIERSVYDINDNVSQLAQSHQNISQVFSIQPFGTDWGTDGGDADTFTTILAYNSVFDILNNPLDVLQA